MRHVLLLVTLIAVSTITFHPSVVSAASFDCSKASTAVEGSICANSTLSTLDKELADVYLRAQSASADTGKLIQAQSAWMETRNACGADAQCLEKSYRQRISELQSGASEPVNCFDNESQVKAIAGYSGSYHTIISDADRMNSSGQPIKGFRAFLAQDRANVNRFNRGEASEEPDVFFATPERRAMLRDAQIRSRCGQNMDALIRQLEAQGSTVPLNIHIVSSGPQLWVYLDQPEIPITVPESVASARQTLDFLFDSNRHWVNAHQTNSSGQSCDSLISSSKTTLAMQQYTKNKKIINGYVGGQNPRRADPEFQRLVAGMGVVQEASYRVTSTEPVVTFTLVSQSQDSPARFTENYELDVHRGTLTRIGRTTCEQCDKTAFAGQPESAVFYWCAKGAVANDLQMLDGNWYSKQWNYGYELKNGVGIATSTNSPNFVVGQKILQLNQVGPNQFAGEQIYRDGKFYKVSVTLLPDGRLSFEGERNVKWVMERTGAPSSSNQASAGASQAPAMREESAKSNAARQWARCSGYLGGAVSVLKEFLPRTVGSARNDINQVIAHLDQNAETMWINAGGELFAAGITDMNAITSRLVPDVNLGRKLALEHGATDPLTFITPGSQAQGEVLGCLNMK